MEQILSKIFIGLFFNNFSVALIVIKTIKVKIAYRKNIINDIKIPDGFASQAYNMTSK